MADAAHTLTRTRNPIVDEDKIRAAWNRRVASLDRATKAYETVGRRWEKSRAIFEAEKPAEPDCDWALLGYAHLGRRVYPVLYAISIDVIREKAKATNEWRFPHKTDAEIELEVAKIKEFRLKMDVADARSGMEAASNAIDEAQDRKWAAQDELLLTPAPDLDAVQMKIEHLFGDDVIEGESDARSWPRKFTDTLIADVRRLNQQSKEA